MNQSSGAGPLLTARESWQSGQPYLATVLGLHLVALWLWVPAALNTPLLWGVGLTAYLFGLRHAWDADHIAVIDNTSRKLLHLSRPSYGVGLFFSLGHSSVVFLMAVAAALLGQRLLGYQGSISLVGGWVGPLVAGVYLLTLAAVNLYTTYQLYWGADPEASHHHGGLLARLIVPLTHLVNREWHIYPLGFLMGLGFDTASEVALLALTAQSAGHGLSWAAILSLPLLFAAGMSLLDTADGIAMTHAYRWAQVDAGKKRTYSLLVTGLSGALALIIGAVTLAQWSGEHFSGAARALAAAQAWDISALGFWLAGLTALLFTWSYWKTPRST